MLDVRLPGMDGLTAIEHFRQRVGHVPIVVITAYGDLGTAVEAVRNGAFEYIVKPFDLQQMERVIVRALESIQETGNAGRQTGGDGPPVEHVGGIVGRTPAMQEVFKRIALVAASDASVLLCGESGTGKELAARAVHRYSNRAEGPFVAVNVGSLSPTLAESELFGHVRGAFTGADESHTGLLVRADGGTLFLDEVADIPLPTQVKLLRALEHGEVLPVGSSETVKTDFRVISATHQSLEKNIKQGAFRHDLYFRLCGFQIDLPPLRDRTDDMAELAEHFLFQFSRENGPRGAGFPACHDESAGSKACPTPRLSDEALAELKRRPWYGNVRELRNAVEHAAILARGGTIIPEHLPPPAEDPSAISPAGISNRESEITALLRQWAEAKLSDPAQANEVYAELLRLVEPPVLEAALEKHFGHCSQAARTLGLHRTTLKKKLDQHGLGEL